MPELHLVLADGWGSLVWVTILILWFLNAIVKSLQGGNKGPAEGGGQVRPARPQPLGKPEDQSLRKEIEKFLQQLSGEKSSDTVTPPMSRSEGKDKEVSRPLSTAPKRTKPRKSNREEVKTDKAKVTSGLRKHTEIEKTVTPHLGDGVTKHVQQHLQLHVEPTITRHSSFDIEQQVRSHLGEPHAALSTPHSYHPEHPFLAVLRRPQDVRQALLLSELLSKPLSLR